MSTRPVGRPLKYDSESTKRKQIVVDVGLKADMQARAKTAGQSLTDYLLQGMENVISGAYEPVTRRASLRPATNVGIEISVPLSLLAKIEEQMKLYGLTFTDFLLGAWTRRLEAEETA